MPCLTGRDQPAAALLTRLFAQKKYHKLDQSKDIVYLCWLFTQILTQSFAYCLLAQLLTHPPNHSLTHPLTYSVTDPPLAHSFTHSLTTHSFILFPLFVQTSILKYYEQAVRTAHYAKHLIWIVMLHASMVPGITPSQLGRLYKGQSTLEHAVKSLFCTACRLPG